MALIAWLLNGDLNNRGVGAVTVTNHGATLDNTCKIGKGYSFNGNDSYVSLNSSSINKLFNGGSQKFTITAWVYHSDTSQAILFGDYLLPGAQNFSLELSTAHGIRFFWNGSPDIVFTTNLTGSAWNHIAITYDGQSVKYYLNGTYKDAYNAALTTKSKTSGDWYLGRDSRTGNTALNGKLNDFRLYDECLSAEQIKEISRGMVLHYKMCQPERSENLLTNGAASKITCRSQQSEYSVKSIRTTLENNTQYTLSFDARSDNGLGTFYCSLANGSSSQIYYAKQIKPTTKYKHYVYTVTRGTQTTNNILFAAYYGWSGNANVTDTIHIKNVKLEKGANPNAMFSPPPTESLNWGTTEYDGSGLKNHGTISGNVTLSADSPRYTGSYNLSNGNYITAPGLTYINSGSISFWAKVNDVASSGWLPFRGVSGEHYIMATSSGVGNFYHKNIGNGTKTIYEDGKVVTAPSSNGVWHHYVITNVDLTKWTIFMINNHHSSWNANMQMSDVRIYATVLDATDVSELYKLGR